MAMATWAARADAGDDSRRARYALASPTDLRGSMTPVSRDACADRRAELAHAEDMPDRAELLLLRLAAVEVLELGCLPSLLLLTLDRIDAVR